MEPAKRQHVAISLSDPSELRSLREHLRRLEGLQVIQTAGTPSPRDLGAGDALEIVITGGTVLTFLIRALSEFARSRRSSVTVKLRSKKGIATVTAHNVDDVQAIIDRLLGDA